MDGTFTLLIQINQSYFRGRKKYNAVQTLGGDITRRLEEEMQEELISGLFTASGDEEDINATS